MNDASPLSTLGLGGHGDEAGLLAAVERAFGVRISAAEVDAVVTVGDLFDAMLLHASPHSAAGKCASAMAFHRLRRALAGQAPHEAIVPAAKLADVVTSPPYRFHAVLERSSGLNVPGFHFSKLGNVGLILAVLGPATMLAAVLLRYPAWPCAFAFVAGVAMMFADQRELPDITLGAFARELAALNYATFARAGASTTEAGLWEAFVLVLRTEAGIQDGEIERDTRLIG